MKKNKIIKVKPNIDYTKYGFVLHKGWPDKIKYCIYDKNCLFTLEITQDYVLRIIHFNYETLAILLKLGKDNLIEICPKTQKN